MRSIAVSGALAMLAAAQAAPTADPAPPNDAVLLFVASWCAPCHGEVRALPALAAAAAPMTILVAAVDDTRATGRMLAWVPAGQRWGMPPDRAHAAMRRLAGGAPGLPTSVAINRRGEVCTVVRKPLTPAIVAAIKARCATPAN